MTERSKESLFDRLLKSRYPLTHYLSRQQQFLVLFPTASIPLGTTFISSKKSSIHSFKEGETNAIRRRKTPCSSSSKVECIFRTIHLPSMTKIPLSLFQLAYDTSNGMISDQDYNTAQGDEDLVVHN